MTFLVGWAFEHGKTPSKVLRLYKKNPRDFYLLMAYGNYKAEREKKEIEEANRKAAKK